MFAGKKSAQIREILISESAWEEMTCLFAPSLASVGLKLSDGYTRAALLLKMKGSVSLNFAVDGKPVTVTLHMTESGDVTATTDYDDSTATAAAAATTTPTQESVEKPAEESVEEPEKSNTRKGPRPK